jgi:5-methyltetrahydropteroyltriglutamate--homocysteine methyltransferase
VEIMFAREDGIPIDENALQARIERGVGEAVEHQVRSGVDIVNDGEWSKPSYATYIKDRLHGFGGTGTSYVFQDLEDYPRSKLRMFGDPGRKHRKTPACNAPSASRTWRRRGARHGEPHGRRGASTRPSALS